MEVPKFNRDTPIREIQAAQDEYDGRYWEHDRTFHENINHVEHHIGKMIGKIATWTEAVEHGNHPSLDQLKNEVTPDLLFWALHFANLFGLDIEEVYQKRLEDNIRRLHPETLTLTLTGDIPQDVFERSLKAVDAIDRSMPEEHL